jgi:hypothetical protein
VDTSVVRSETPLIIPKLKADKGELPAAGKEHGD